MPLGYKAEILVGAVMSHKNFMITVHLSVLKTRMFCIGSRYAEKV